MEHLHRSDVSELSRTIEGISAKNEQYQLKTGTNLESLRMDVLAVLNQFRDEDGPTTMETYTRLHRQQQDPNTHATGLEAQLLPDSQQLTTALSSLEIAARENHFTCLSCARYTFVKYH